MCYSILVLRNRYTFQIKFERSNSMNNSTENYWHTLKADFMDYIKEEPVRTQEFKHYSRSIDLLIDFAMANKHDEYSPEVGMAFYESEQIRGYHGITTLGRRRATIRRLNESLYGNNFWQRKPRNLRTYKKQSNAIQCPEQFSEVLEKFLELIKNQGLKEVTVYQYRNSCTKMLLDFVELGVNEWSDINAKILTATFIQSTNKYHFVTYAKRLFQYLVENEIITTNYAGVLPSMTKRKTIPSIYSEKEINHLLDSVETLTPQGKRDYAIILIAVRLGLRASDIRLLCFENINFENATLKFTQYKTSVDQQLSVPIAVINALNDYIDHGREQSQEHYLFLDGYANPLASHSVSDIVSRHFLKSGIDIGDRKHGPHALRMTFASQLVSEKVPYEVVRTLLGHVNAESTRHYVEFSIEGLRTCALETPPPSGLLEKYLTGEEV